jgi:hypothetical protein
MIFEPKHGPPFELSGGAARRGLSRTFELSRKAARRGLS